MACEEGKGAGSSWEGDEAGDGEGGADAVEAAEDEEE